MHLDMAQATNSKVFNASFWCSLSNRDFLRGRFDQEEVVSFVKASISKADELLRLICAWVEKTHREFELNQELVDALTRFLDCIDVVDFS